MLLSRLQAIGTLVVFFVCFAGYGHLILHSVTDNGRRKETWFLVCLPIGMGFFALLSMGLGLVGAINLWGIWGILVPGIVASGIAGRELTDSVVCFFDNVKRDCVSSTIMGKLTGAVSFLLLSGLFISAFAPPYCIDELVHNLSIPTAYIENGGLYPLIDIVPHGLFPQSGEMIFSAILPLGSGSAAHLLVWGHVVVCSLLIYRISKIISPHEDVGFVAVFLFVSTSTVLHSGNIGYVDYFIFALFAACVCMLLENDNDLYPIIGICTGLALGFKLNAVFYILPMLAYTECKALSNRKLKMACWTLGLFVLFGSPWYLRIWHITGNPFWPMLSNLLGAGPVGPGVLKEGMREILHHSKTLPRTFFGFAAGIPLLFLFPQEYYGTSGTMSPLILVGFPLLVVKSLRPRTKRGLKSLLFMAGLFGITYMACFLTQPRVRYLLAPIMLLCIGSAVALTNLYFLERTVLLKIILVLSFVAWSICSAIGFVRYNGNAFKHVIRNTNQQTFLMQVADGPFSAHSAYPVIRRANETLPDDAVVLCLPDKPYYLNFRWIRMPRLKSMVERMNISMPSAAKRCRVSHVVLGPDQNLPKEIKASSPTPVELDSGHSDGKIYRWCTTGQR